MKKTVYYLLAIILFSVLTILIIANIYFHFFTNNILANHKLESSNFITRIIDHFRPQSIIIAPALRAEKTIHIPEGFTNQDIARYLSKQEPWTSKDFLQVVGSVQAGSKIATSSSYFSTKFPFLKDRPPGADLEGYLFPDTYRIYASSTVKEIVSKMLNNFNEKLTPKMRADIKSQGKTIYEIITMASLVEKEAPINYHTDNNRNARIIAGIFWNRLKRGQALESDATLSYILNDTESQHQGKALEINSKYNTYKYRGLPPGPISNPGILAIKAAIYPLLTSYNYFLTPSGTKTVVYAKTYAQHLRNSYKYLR